MKHLPARCLRIACTTGSLALLALSLSGCPQDKPAERRGPPPPPAASVPSASPVCAQGGGKIADPTIAALFARSASGYCIDPNAEVRRFGAGADKPLDAICTEAFNGDCEVYKGFGLERVVILRYVDGAGSPGSVDVVMSKYATVDGAYGMFTKRVISDGDPAREGAPAAMKVAGVGARGTGTAYLWKAQLVIELTYTNEKQTPAQLASTSASLLDSLGAAIAQRLPGPETLPVSASRLPVDNRIPLGISFEPKDAFEVLGAGAGAYGYYREGNKRYRVLSITRDDDAQAKDVLTTLAKREGAKREKDIGDGAVRMMVGDGEGPRTEWLFARKGSQVFGVGDEESVLQSGMSSAERDAVCLTRDDKVSRLRALLTPAK